MLLVNIDSPPMIDCILNARKQLFDVSFHNMSKLARGKYRSYINECNLILMYERCGFVCRVFVVLLFTFFFLCVVVGFEPRTLHFFFFWNNPLHILFIVHTNWTKLMKICFALILRFSKKKGIDDCELSSKQSVTIIVSLKNQTKNKGT